MMMVSVVTRVTRIIRMIGQETMMMMMVVGQLSRFVPGGEISVCLVVGVGSLFLICFCFVFVSLQEEVPSYQEGAGGTCRYCPLGSAGG